MNEPDIKPGIYRDIPIEQYHAGPGVSKSQLDLLNKSPALLEWSRKAPRDEDARAAVDIGQALHTVLLQPETFDDLFVVEFSAPRGAILTAEDCREALDSRGIPWKAKDSKQALVAALLENDPDAPVIDSLREQWAAGAAGKIVLTTAEARKVQLMRDSVMAHPFARRLIEADGPCESSVYWTDDEAGELCRARPDKLAQLGATRAVVDLKTTAHVDEFWRAVDDYRYDVQDAFYTAGCEHHFGERMPFMFIAVSSTRDAGRYPVRVFTLPADLKIRGQDAMRKDLNTYAGCRRTGNWPGVELVTRPPWARY